MTGLALVTGATGFVGSHVARHLADRGWRVRVLVRSTSRMDNLAGVSCEPVVGDLRDASTLGPAVRGCDAVFHVAADYRLWSPDSSQLYRTNVDGTLALFRAAHEAGVPRAVYTSTVGVLGVPPGGKSGDEHTPVTLSDMVGHYKRSKFLAEEAVRNLVTEAGFPVVIVNPSTPVGPRDIKPTPTGKIIVDFLNGKMPAFVDTGLNLVDVRDVAAGHLLALERGVPGERYILGNENLTLQRILQILADICGRRAPRVRIPYLVAYGAALVDSLVEGNLLHREPAIPLEGVRMAHKRMFFDASRAVRELGLPQSPVREALEQAIAWYCENGYVRPNRANH